MDYSNFALYPEDLGEVVRYIFRHISQAKQLFPQNPHFQKENIAESDLWAYITRDKIAVIVIYLKVKHEIEKDQL